VNLVGHVAAALTPGLESSPPTDFLVGCMLPDLAAIARVRLRRADGDIGAGVSFHHACDAAFHETAWFRATNVALRDALVDVGVDRGPARACSHAGVEMLLDGELVTEVEVARHARLVLRTVDARADEFGNLATPEARGHWVERLRLIGSSLRPDRYGDARFVAERLHRMTAGRRRIELSEHHVAAVAATLREFQAPIAATAPGVLATVRRDVPGPHRSG
jgi:hypothetical protein